MEKLKVIETVQNAESKFNLFCKCGIPEGIICSWMKEEVQLHLFLYSLEDDIGPRRKKTRLCENSYVDKCLCK
jgi:hypothetical protein